MQRENSRKKKCITECIVLTCFNSLLIWMTSSTFHGTLLPSCGYLMATIPTNWSTRRTKCITKKRGRKTKQKKRRKQNLQKHSLLVSLESDILATSALLATKERRGAAKIATLIFVLLVTLSEAAVSILFLYFSSSASFCSLSFFSSCFFSIHILIHLH